jgi:hypothetical protein
MPLNKTIIIAGLCCLVIPALASSPTDVPADHWARGHVQSVTSKKIMDAPGNKFHGDRFVTRYELAATLDKFVDYVEAGKAPLHPRARPKPGAKIPAHASAAVKAALIHLTDNAFIPTDSILLQGSGSEPVTADQLRQIMSQVVIRLSDRSIPQTEDIDD